MLFFIAQGDILLESDFELPYDSPHGKSHKLCHLSHCTIAARIPCEHTVFEKNCKVRFHLFCHKKEKRKKRKSKCISKALKKE